MKLVGWSEGYQSLAMLPKICGFKIQMITINYMIGQ